MHDCLQVFNDCTPLMMSTDVDCFKGVDLGGLWGGDRPGCHAIQRQRPAKGRQIFRR